MGEISIPTSEYRVVNVFSVLMSIGFMLVVNILYINLLIAMMSTSYEHIVAKAEAESVLIRTEAILRWESTMSEERRKEVYGQVVPQPGVRGHLTLFDGWFPVLQGEKRGSEIFVESEEIEMIEAESFDSLNPTISPQEHHEQYHNELNRLYDEVKELKILLKK